MQELRICLERDGRLEAFLTARRGMGQLRGFAPRRGMHCLPRDEGSYLLA